MPWPPSTGNAVPKRLGCPPQEWSRTLREIPKELQRHAFYKCWTSKEAFLKARGTGLSGKLDEVEITLAGERRIQIHAHVAGWSLIPLHPGDGYESALVIESRAAEIVCYRWQAPCS